MITKQALMSLSSTIFTLDKVPWTYFNLFSFRSILNIIAFVKYSKVHISIKDYYS